jgi:predicted HNH restriction endonuclease/predicted RNA-binding protein with PUA-like domain
LNTWIFQGNPKVFNIDSYIAQNKYIRWSIRQEHFLKTVEQGDIVYIWRSEAGKKGSGGIVAKAIIISDDDFLGQGKVSDYYFDEHNADQFQYVSLEVMEHRLTKGYISRKFLLQHTFLRDLKILHMRNETNYLMQNKHATEIHKLWDDSKTKLEFPKLQPKKRDREYNKFSEYLRDKIIYESLINGQSNRWIDEHVLAEDAEYSRGWFSMGILHHLGLNEDHKGYFINQTASDAVNHLSKLNGELYKPIIVALIRYSQNINDDLSMDNFTPPTNVTKLLKQVGKSQYSDGVRIDKEFHEIFNPPTSSFYVPRGKARKVKILFNNKIFDSEYRYEDQTDKNIELQSIRFRKELKKEFEKVFPIAEGEFYIEQGVDLNHFVFSHTSISILDTTDEDEEIEYSEGKESYRLHRIRERKPEVVKKAKEAFLKNYKHLFCQACNFDFTKTYGDRGQDFIEGHHKKLVSEMKDGEKTKPEDIAMLCSNCHRMIHRNPLITVEELAALIESNRKLIQST